MTDKMVSCILNKSNAEIDYDLKIEKDGSVNISRVVDAKTLDLQESAIVQACIDAAREAGIHELIVMDKQFVLEALWEKIKREKHGQIDTMTGSEYQRLAMRTAKPRCRKLANAGLGLAGEAGEVADEIKKQIFHNHPMNREKLIKEAGDVAWYLALLCEVLGTTLDEVFKTNISKLMERYPDGFDTERSLHRKEGDV